MADQIVVSYKDNLDEFIKQLKTVSEGNKVLTKQVTEFGDKSKVAGDKATASLGQVNKTASVGENLFNKLGVQIAAAFSVGAIIAWSTAALTSYKEQEKALTQLKASIETVANEGTQAFNKLVSQAEKLQKVSIFSDEQIEQTQTMLINFGLTSRQTEILTNRIVDFASRTGKSIEEATGIFIRGIQGQTRGLIDAGAKFDDTGSKVGNFNALLVATEKFAGGAATALGTQAGQLANVANQIDDINEKTGEALAPIELLIAKIKLFASTIIKDFFEDGLLQLPKKLLQSFLNIGPIQNTIGKFLFGDKDPKEFPKDLDPVLKALDEIAARKEKAFSASLNKSILGLSDKELQEEIKRLESLDEANTIAVKDRVDLINKELEIRGKAREKAIEEEKKQFEAQRKIWEAGREEYEKIEKEKADFQRKVFEVAKEEFEKAEKDKADFQRKEFEVAKEEYEKFLEDQVKSQEEAEQRKRENIEATINAAQTLLSDLNNLFSAQDAQQIDAINERKDAQIDSIDAQLEALEEANDKGRISDKKFEQEKKKLIDARAAAEKKAAEEAKRIKIAEAEREKAFAIFSIILNTAIAVSKVLTNPFLLGLTISLGAAQLAIAVSTPIPAFAKGTKGKKESGMGLVGEQGAEFVYMPQGTQVVPADRTRKYKDAVNAMIDGKFEDYVYKAMIAPALREATRKMERDRQKSFAENIANNFMINNAGIDPYRLRDGMRLNNKEAAEAFAKAMGKYFNNGYSNPRYH